VAIKKRNVKGVMSRDMAMVWDVGDGVMLVRLMG